MSFDSGQQENTNHLMHSRTFQEVALSIVICSLSNDTVHSCCDFIEWRCEELTRGKHSYWICLCLYFKASTHVYGQVTREKQKDTSVLHTILRHSVQEKSSFVNTENDSDHHLGLLKSRLSWFLLPTAKRALNFYVTLLVPISASILPIL